ncbi:hypothetical protein DMENIID0001_154810 [Sergentomyia squamirostris]
MSYYVLILTTSLVFAVVSSGLENPEVCAPAGCVRGVVKSGRLKAYEAFYGIPYAEPPIGELRFRNPVPYNGWSGIWDASYFRNDCMQKNYYMPGAPRSGSEDCLHLNIYRPIDWASKGRLPVFLWIHGGGYVAFSSSPEQFGPEYLMDNGEVIVVTFNYRLGLFGFMCSGDIAVQGNFGLKDQQVAMAWVAKNIEDFGGDSGSVTLAGQSAGGESVNLHMMAEKSQSLFHRSVMTSGNAFTSFAYPIDFEAQMRTAAKACGLQDWETGTTAELADQFRNVPDKILVDAVDSLFAYVLVTPIPMRFCVEGDWEGAFLSEDPRRVWSEGRFQHKPILTGVMSDEGIAMGILVANDTINQGYNENIYNLLPIQFDFDPKWTDEVLQYYFDGKLPINEANEEAFFKMNSDRLEVAGWIDLVRKYIQYADVEENPISIYEFAYEGNYTFYKYFTGFDEHKGTCHIDDLIYLFTMTAFFPVLTPGCLDGEMSDIYVRTMVHFAKTGKVKEWTPLRPCCLSTSQPFCDYQVFKKSAEEHSEILITTSNFVDEDMVKFWKMVDGVYV